MLNTSAYYDSNVLNYFLYHPTETNHDYFPTKKYAHISVFCEEELLHKAISNNLDTYNVNSDIFDFWRRLDAVRSFFRPNKDIQLNVLSVKLSDIISSFIRSKVTLNSTGDKKLDGMDWMHLAMADLLECENFVTADKDFEFFEKISGVCQFNSLKNVIQLDRPKNMAFVKSIRLI